MNKKELKYLFYMVLCFLVFYFLPVESKGFKSGIFEAFALAKWYAREHVVFCLIPAFFIAGAISVFLKKESVMKYLGAGAKKSVSYFVASVSGTILAVCSCTVLPLFAGIYTMGAGIGPATAFLYSGPAINVLAIILTARVLGTEIGIARAIFAIVFSVLIGLIMAFLFKQSEKERLSSYEFQEEVESKRPVYQNILFFITLLLILVFANFGAPENSTGVFYYIYKNKWLITLISFASLLLILTKWFFVKFLKVLTVFIITLLSLFFIKNIQFTFAVAVTSLTVACITEEGEIKEWIDASFEFTKQILPLLLLGVLIAGFLLGRPNHTGLIPNNWVVNLVGGNSIFANLFASVSGAFMYFATLTEIPILQGLMGNGMGKGPALSLLLAGPALSLPNMLVIKSIMGTKKTIIFVLLVIIMSTITGFIFGNLF